MRKWKKFSYLVIIAAVICGLLVANWVSHSGSEFDRRVHSVTGRYEFSVFRWEVSALLGEMKDTFAWPHRVSASDCETVRKYFAADNPSQSLEDKAERIMTKQIREVLAKEGIMHPLDFVLPFKFIFPPVNFKFESPPSLLVMSPRDEIRLLERKTLEPGLSIPERETIESQLDALNLSALVVGLGGVGFTYPTMIARTGDIRYALDAAVEEWFHQYMALRPMGFLYLLDAVGVRSNYTIVTMNETVAGIMSQEIGEKVYRKYYASPDTPSPDPVPPVSGFDFNKEMRSIRIRVDELLAQGEVPEAEAFMQERRDFLAANGYYIRKLNQAYFAFHGTYADLPTSVDPIGRDMQKLRAQSSSLHKFLNKVSSMTSYEDLQEAVEEGKE